MTAENILAPFRFFDTQVSKTRETTGPQLQDGTKTVGIPWTGAKLVVGSDWAEIGEPVGIITELGEYIPREELAVPKT